MMLAHGFGNPSPDRRYAEADSANPDHHDCLDDCRGMWFSLGGMESAQPRIAGLRRGQRNRASLGWGGNVALSRAIPTRACGETSSPNRRRAAFRGCGRCGCNLVGLAAGISRASAYLLGTGNPGGSGGDHAVARSTKASIVNDDQKRCPEGRCCRIHTVRLSFLDCLGWHWSEHLLARGMGRRGGSIGHNSFHRARGYPVNSWTRVRLLPDALGRRVENVTRVEKRCERLALGKRRHEFHIA